MKPHHTGQRSRYQMTLDPDVMDYLDAMIELGHVKKGAKTYKTRSRAVEHILEEYFLDHINAMNATSQYLLNRTRR